MMQPTAPLTESNPEKLATGSEIAGLLNISPRHLVNLRERRVIPFIRLGRVIRYNRTAVSMAIAHLTVQPRS
jgi:excisionase family DNA binding protein